MILKSSDLPLHELIGLEVKIIKSNNPSLKGKKGIVQFETKNTLHFEEENKMIIAQKSICNFLFHTNTGEAVNLEGNKIAFRPEDRIRTVRK